MKLTKDMTAAELIREAGLCYRMHNGKQVVWTDKNLNSSQVAIINAKKDEIRTELRRRDETEKASLAEKFEKERLERLAKDQVELDKMHAEADELIKSIPEGYVQVEAKKTGSADGYDIMAYSVDGIELSWRDVKVIGTAHAIRPGALNAFETIEVAAIEIKALEAIKAEKAAEKKETAVEIPEAAITAYNKYKGSDAAAWEAEDETAWGLIREWRKHIETQHGPHLELIAETIAEAAREARYGIEEE